MHQGEQQQIISLTDMKKKNKRKYNLELLRPRRSALPEDDIAEDGTAIPEDGFHGFIPEEDDLITDVNDINAIHWAVSGDIAEAIQRCTAELAAKGTNWQWGFATTGATASAATPAAQPALTPAPAPWPWTMTTTPHPITPVRPAPATPVAKQTQPRSSSAEEMDTEQFFTPPEYILVKPKKAAKGHREIRNLIWHRLFASPELTHTRLRTA
jgi:hypothetical protein